MADEQTAAHYRAAQANHLESQTREIPPTLPYLPLPLESLQLSLVGLLSQRLIDFGHDGDLLASVADGCVVLGLRQVSHESQHCDPHRQSSLAQDIGEMLSCQMLSTETNV